MLELHAICVHTQIKQFNSDTEFRWKVIVIANNDDRKVNLNASM